LDLHGFVYRFSYWAIPTLFAITLREVAHGWVARCYGDRSAELLGRLNLNPLRHIDPIGTVIVPALLLALELPIFGWAKPVPVALSALPNPRRTAVLTALAGPTANVVMALFWCAVMGTIIRAAHPGTVEKWVLLMSYAGILANASLAIVYLLPIPPLDGWRVLSAFLPARWNQGAEKFAPAGMFIVVSLSVFKMFGWLLIPTYGVAGQVIGVLSARPAA
jgi:Zn-dependent protease